MVPFFRLLCIIAAPWGVRGYGIAPRTLSVRFPESKASLMRQQGWARKGRRQWLGELAAAATLLGNSDASTAIGDVRLQSVWRDCARACFGDTVSNCMANICIIVALGLPELFSQLRFLFRLIDGRKIPGQSCSA